MSYKLLIEKRRKKYIRYLLNYFKHEDKKPKFHATINNKKIIIILTEENLNSFLHDVYEEQDCKQRFKYSDENIYEAYALFYSLNGNITEIGKLFIDVITKHMPAYLNGEPYVYD